MTDFSTRERGRRRGPEILLLAGGVAAVLLASAGGVAAYRLARAARAALEETQESVASLRGRIRDLEQARVSSEEQKLAGDVVLGAQAPVEAALVSLESVLPSDVRLTSLSVVYEDACQLEMSVEARRPAAYDQFLARLFASPHFAEVAPGAEARGDSLTAAVRARFRGIRR